MPNDTRITTALALNYSTASRTEKAAILDELCYSNDWHRDHARRVLRAALLTEPRPDSLSGSTKYGPEVIEALKQIWMLIDAPTGKRLAPVMPNLVDSLRRHGELDVSTQVAAQLTAMSPATIDRRLAPERAAPSTSHVPGFTELLSARTPVRTSLSERCLRPGFLAVFVTGHHGGQDEGEFCHTVCAFDLATGWSESATVRALTADGAVAALSDIAARLPFSVLGIEGHHDQHSFDAPLKTWCRQQECAYIGGRAERTSRRGGRLTLAVVRPATDERRFDTDFEASTLNALWARLSPMLNFFVPQQKLVSKLRYGSRAVKTYDTAQTPYERLLQQPDSIDTDALRTRFFAANPAQLRREATREQSKLLTVAGAGDSGVRRHTSATKW